MNNTSLVGIGYTQTLRPGKNQRKTHLKTAPKNNLVFSFKNACKMFNSGMKLTLSALVDGKNINAGGHKLGLGLELEA